MTITRDWAATTFVVHNNKTLLLHHRKLRKWLPPGGHVDPHELPDIAALREVTEETGLHVGLLDVGAPLGSVRRLAQPLCILLESITPSHEHIDLIYVAYVIQGNIAAPAREGQPWRWYSWDDLQAPEVPSDVCELGRQAIELVTAWERQQSAVGSQVSAVSNQR
jgi:8-oxo-dGTP pyrophosphatase MutT (NUDIX family)